MARRRCCFWQGCPGGSSLPCESFDEQGAREDVRRTHARDGPFLDDVGFSHSGPTARGRGSCWWGARHSDGPLLSSRKTRNWAIERGASASAVPGSRRFESQVERNRRIGGGAGSHRNGSTMVPTTVRRRSRGPWARESGTHTRGGGHIKHTPIWDERVLARWTARVCEREQEP